MKLRRWWDLLCDVGPKFGYYPNAAKTFLVAKPEREDEACTVFSGTGVTLNASGKCYLSGALGQASFEENFMKEMMADSVKRSKKLADIAKIPPQAA